MKKVTIIFLILNILIAAWVGVYFLGNLVTIKYEYELGDNEKISNYLYLRANSELISNLAILLINCIFIIYVLRKNRNKTSSDHKNTTLLQTHTFDVHDNSEN